jgi:hypothetical protein
MENRQIPDKILLGLHHSRNLAKRIKAQPFDKQMIERAKDIERDLDRVIDKAQELRIIIRRARPRIDGVDR